MIPQYIAVKTSSINAWCTRYTIGVEDENYEFHRIDDTPDKAQARIIASNAATEYRVPIAKQAERLLGM